MIIVLINILLECKTNFTIINWEKAQLDVLIYDINIY